jgi:hypothetical protein
MKTILKPLILSLLFTGICFMAKAQSLPDTIRIRVGGELASANGIFGVAVNTPASGTASSAYSIGAGASLAVDYPITEHWYITASAGYTNYFKSSSVNTSEQAVNGVSSPNFETIPLKLGLKIVLGNRLYVQGEIGETFLANKTALYAIYNNAFTYSPNVGVIIPLKKKRTYIDGGIRFESMTQSYYNNTMVSSFWALHVAYAFNL